jgi:Ca2+-binding EF-hand superfamily protein
MKSFTLFRAAALALAMTAVGSAALADGDIYSRLFEMKQMDRNKDGMVSKDEFLAMVAKAWDMQAADMKVVGHKMTAEQIKELEKILGRTLSAQSGT